MKASNGLLVAGWPSRWTVGTWQFTIWNRTRSMRSQDRQPARQGTDLPACRLPLCHGVTTRTPSHLLCQRNPTPQQHLRRLIAIDVGGESQILGPESGQSCPRPCRSWIRTIDVHCAQILAVVQTTSSNGCENANGCSWFMLAGYCQMTHYRRY